MGVTINQLLGWDGPLTHRQMVTWALFSEEMLNRPSLTDHYIMSLNATVARLFAKNPASIEGDNFRLVFKRKGAKLTEKERKEQLEFQKASLIARFGGMGNLTIVDHLGNVIKRPDPPKRSGRQRKLIPQQVISQNGETQSATGQNVPSLPEGNVTRRRIRGRGGR